MTLKAMNRVIEGLRYGDTEFLCFCLNGTLALRARSVIITPFYPATSVKYYTATHRLYAEGVGGPWWWVGVHRA